MGKKFRSFLPTIGAVVGNAIAPGIGGVIGGAAGGAASGGGVKGALTGGLSGGAIGYAPQIGGFANEALGLGLQNTSSLAGLGGALGGAAAGGVSGGLKGALTGGLTGGAAGYLSNGGLGEIGNALGFGSAGTVASNGMEVGKVYDVLNPNTPWLDEVARGALKPNIATGELPWLNTGSGGLPSLSSLISGGGGGGNMFLSGLSAANQYRTMGKMEKDMLDAQRRAEAAMAPYQRVGAQANEQLGGALQSGELGGDFNFQADPGYQFRKQQGEEALMRAQSARGGMFSGQALREAMDLNQGLADQAYNDAFGRDIARQQNLYGMLSGTAGRGQGAAGTMGGIYDTMGDIRANALLGKSNALTNFAADALGGDIIGYRADGTPITRQSALLGLF